MRAFAEVIRIELKALTRSWTAPMLLLAGIAWTAAVPFLVCGDGTPAGARELDIRFSLGGVFALLVVALLASATGSVARERAERRLQLTLVRPVRRTAVLLGKTLAHIALGGVVLTVSAAVLLSRVDPSAPCSHVLAPVLPPVEQAAAAAYAECMADTNTPAAVRAAPKAAVMRLLTAREIDRYDVIATNATASWRFSAAGDAVRVRFTNTLEMRQNVRGTFRSGAASCTVSNVTQSTVKFPLATASGEVAFENLGTRPLMLRPRRDIQLLRSADSFAANLARACVVLVATLSLVVAFGTFLGACLSRPVALFAALTTMVVGEISPSVIEQYPDELEENRADRIGLMITRCVESATRPLTADSPIEALSSDECVEPARVWRSVLVNLVTIPVALAVLGAWLLPRKQDDLA